MNISCGLKISGVQCQPSLGQLPEINLMSVTIFSHMYRTLTFKFRQMHFKQFTMETRLCCALAQYPTLTSVLINAAQQKNKSSEIYRGGIQINSDNEMTEQCYLFSDFNIHHNLSLKGIAPNKWFCFIEPCKSYTVGKKGMCIQVFNIKQ